MGSPTLTVESGDPSANAIANAQILFWDGVLAQQARFDPAALDDGTFAINPLDRARKQHIAALDEVIDDLLALGIANFLQDDLLGRLGADPAKLSWLELFLDVVADFDFGHLASRLRDDHLEVVILKLAVGHDQPAPIGLMVSGRPIDRDAKIHLVVESLLGGRGERAFESAEHDFAFHIFLARQRVDHH